MFWVDFTRVWDNPILARFLVIKTIADTPRTATTAFSEVSSLALSSAREFQPDKSDPIRTLKGKMASDPPKVLISYSHDSQKHEVERERDLSTAPRLAVWGQTSPELQEGVARAETG
jgi:hypothetical protein